MNIIRLGLGLAACGTISIAIASAAPVASKAKDTVQVQTALDGAGSGQRETNLGDLIADAVRQTGGAEIALVPANEISDASVPAGSVPAADIVHALRYADDSSDTVVVLNLTGAQILKAVERSVSRAPEPFTGFLQVSGLQIRYDSAAPEGKRVGLVGAGGSELSGGKTYKVATTRPIADGGLGYFQIWDKGDIAENTSQPISQSVAAYLAAHKTVNNVVEGRISAGH